jgi:3-oxoacyl-[acyl-carrier protein] reductase
MRVVITGRRPDVLHSAAAEIRELTGAEVHPVVSDLSDPSAPQQLVDAVRTDVGELDVVVVNTGGPPPGRILQVEDPDWYRGVETLLLGPLRLVRPVLPGMGERGFGRVVFITSTAVRRPQPDLSVSVVLRSAVTAAAKLLSLEYADAGVTVNCVAPGATDTGRRRQILAARASATGLSEKDLDQADAAAIPVGRAGEPTEIAAAIGFLASDEAGYINGTVLTVDGGQTEAIW